MIARVIARYTLPEMGALWTDEARFTRMLRVEIAALRMPSSATGSFLPGAREAIEGRARIDVERIAELEQTTDHDVIAFVSQVAETVGPKGRFLHFGLTSSDVVDTALALQCRAAADLILAELDELIAHAHREGARARRDRDDGPHPFGPRRADHVRPEARLVGVRAGARSAAP